MAKKKTVKPTGVNELLSNLGITPGSGRSGPSRGQLTQIGNQRRASAPAPAPRAGVSQPRMAGAGTTGAQTPILWGNGLQNTVAASDDGDSGWGVVGDIFMKAVEIVDTPRALIVSGAKELGDFGQNLTADLTGFQMGDGDDASWSDFTEQADRHMGFGEMWAKESPLAGKNKWVDRGVGLFGDVISDPLTWTGTGVASKTADGLEASKALKTALETGNRSTIGKATAAAVRDAGIEGGEQLIVNAARKGKGAFTAKALRESGLAADDIVKLGVPKLQREFMGIGIKGTTRLTDLTEGMKGTFKAWTGSTKAGKAFRAHRISEAWGTRALTDIIRESSGDVERQAMAVKALGTISEAKTAAHSWVDLNVRTIRDSELGKALRTLDDTSGAALVHSVENGFRDGAAGEFNSVLTRMHNELTALGVDVPFRENYVPHFVTADAARLAGSNPKMKVFIEGLGTKEGFQKARLSADSIAVANAKFQAEFGTSKLLFETDPEIILQRYMFEATDAIGRAVQTKAFKELGIVKELTPEVVLKAQDDVFTVVGKGTKFEEKVTVASAERELAKVEKRALKHADKAMEVRARQSEIAVEALKSKKGELHARIRKLDQHVKDMGRKRVAAEGAVARIEKKLAGLDALLSEKRALLVSSRKNVRAKLLREIRGLETEIASKTVLQREASNKVKYIMEQYSVPLGDRTAATRGFVAEGQRLSVERSTLKEANDRLTGELESLKIANTAPGDGPLVADQVVAEARAKVEKQVLKHGVASNKLWETDNLFELAIAGRETTKPLLDAQLADVTLALGHTGKRYGNVTTLGKKVESLAEIRDNMIVVRNVLESVGDPISELVAQVDVVGAMIDAKIAKLGFEADSLKATIDQLKSPEFRQYIRGNVDAGFKQLNTSNLQIPDWMENAINVRTMMDDPKFWDGAVEFFDKASNVWKGWAIARPGFVVRNIYSSMFNVYLEAGVGAVANVAKFKKFYKIYTDNPETYMARALESFGDETLVARMDEALRVTHGAGSGQGSQEIVSNVFAGKSWINPLNPEFAPVRGIRKWNEAAENVIRGGHALDVLQRGGSTDLAVDTIEKWHFNYRDLTDFDRKMKRPMPFWTFFSKNMALQANTFTRTLPKLNRTYFNVQRNLAYGEEPDTDTPTYFDRAMPLRLPGVDDDGTVNYLFPDLPAVQFANDLDKVVNFRDGRILGDMSPFLKTPAELFMDKQFFSGQEFQDWARPRETPWYADLPGVSNVLDATGLTQTGGVSGERLWTDRSQYVAQAALPPLTFARTGTGDDAVRSWLGWLGVSTRGNTEQSRKSERYRRQDAIQAELDRVNSIRES